MANMALQLKKSLTAVVIGLCIAGLMAIAVVALLQSGPTDEDGEQLPKRFSYDIQALREIDAALIKFKETLSIPIEMDVPRAIAVGPADANRKSAEKIYVGGDRQILVFDGDRSKAASYPLEFEPRALAVMPARIYVAAASRVFVLDGDGGLIDTWPDRGGRALFLDSFVPVLTQNSVRLDIIGPSNPKLNRSPRSKNGASRELNQVWSTV